MNTFIKAALAKDKTKPMLMKPFQVDGHLCSSDGYRLHIVLEGATNESDPTPGVTDFVRTVLTTHKGAFGGKKASLVAACKQAKTLQPEGHSVLFYTGHGKLCVQAQNQEFGNTECVMPVAELSAGEPLSVCLNVAYVLKALSAFKGDTVFIKPGHDGLVRFEQDEHIAIIMPMTGASTPQRQHGLADAPVPQRQHDLADAPAPDFIATSDMPKWVKEQQARERKIKASRKVFTRKNKNYDVLPTVKRALKNAGVTLTAAQSKIVAEWSKYLYDHFGAHVSVERLERVTRSGRYKTDYSWRDCIDVIDAVRITQTKQGRNPVTVTLPTFIHTRDEGYGAKEIKRKVT